MYHGCSEPRKGWIAKEDISHNWLHTTALYQTILLGDCQDDNEHGDFYCTSILTSRLSGNRHQKVCLPLTRMLSWPTAFISTVSPIWKLLWKHRYWSCFISSKYNTCLLSHYLQKSIIICSLLSTQEYQVQIKDWVLIFYLLIPLDPGNPASFYFGWFFEAPQPLSWVSGLMPFCLWCYSELKSHQRAKSIHFLVTFSTQAHAHKGEKSVAKNN